MAEVCGPYPDFVLGPQVKRAKLVTDERDRTAEFQNSVAEQQNGGCDERGGDRGESDVGDEAGHGLCGCCAVSKL